MMKTAQSAPMVNLTPPQPMIYRAILPDWASALKRWAVEASEMGHVSEINLQIRVDTCGLMVSGFGGEPPAGKAYSVMIFWPEVAAMDGAVSRAMAEIVEKVRGKGGRDG